MFHLVVTFTIRNKRRKVTIIELQMFYIRTFKEKDYIKTYAYIGRQKANTSALSENRGHIYNIRCHAHNKKINEHCRIYKTDERVLYETIWQCDYISTLSE